MVSVELLAQSRQGCSYPAHRRRRGFRQENFLTVAFPPWTLSAVDGDLLLPSAWRHRLNVDFIPARLIGGERDEFAVGRDSALTGAPISRANRNRLLASVQRKENHSAR